MLTRTFDPKAETRIIGRLEYWVSRLFSGEFGLVNTTGNTDIPPGDSEHTDTITSANIVYNF
jgi:hypothetical protein